MSTRPEHDPLAEAFASMRSADERRLPDFEQSWNAAISRQNEPRMSSPAMKLLATAAIVGIVCWAMWPAVHKSPPHQIAIVTPQSAPTGASDNDLTLTSMPITEWESPTAFLLSDPADANWPSDNTGELQ